MEANELRLGNLLDSKGDTIKVKAVNTDGFIQYSVGDSEIYGEPIESFEPIPLTPEWLERFGFEKINFTKVDGFYFELPYQQYIYKFENITLSRRLKKLMDYNFIANLEHVHQLQNLYFALTSKEL